MILTAAMPLLLLIILTLLFRFLPAILGESTENAAAAPPPANPLPPQPRVVYKPVDDATQKAISSVVDGQLTAIQKRDFAGALKFSAPDFRASWSPERFGAMLADGYGLMLSTTGWTMERAKTSGMDAQINVRVRGQNGQEALHMFILSQHDDKWYVSGCTPSLIPIATHPERPMTTGIRPSPKLRDIRPSP
jgi:hypothetical protein